MTAAEEQRINNLLFNLPGIQWAIPSSCGLKCAFHFKYDALVLDCHDIPLDDYHVFRPYSEQFDVY